MDFSFERHLVEIFLRGLMIFAVGFALGLRSDLIQLFQIALIILGGLNV